MKKRDLEEILRAASRLTQETEFFIIGSQAVHAWSKRVLAEVLLSRECDLYPKSRQEAADLLNLRLGRSSAFARRHGFYADVVTPEIATLPKGWQSRLKSLRAGKVKALCLEIHDLIVSKLAAGRLKDFELVGALLQKNVADIKVLRRRIAQLPLKTDRTRLRIRLKLLLDELR